MVRGGNLREPATRRHPAAERLREGGGTGETHKCFVRQLLCLYPFPHCSHRSSIRLLFLPSLVRGWPSLARLIRLLESLSDSSPDVSWLSSMALLPFSCLISALLGKLGGGDGRLPTKPDRTLDPLETVCLREDCVVMGRTDDRSLSRSTAARALTLAAGLVTDLRRVTRWLGLRELVSSEWEEWELARVWVLPVRVVVEDPERDGRCVNGLEDCCGSYRRQRGIVSIVPRRVFITEKNLCRLLTSWRRHLCVRQISHEDLVPAGQQSTRSLRCNKGVPYPRRRHSGQVSCWK